MVDGDCPNISCNIYALRLTWLTVQAAIMPMAGLQINHVVADQGTGVELVQMYVTCSPRNLYHTAGCMVPAMYGQIV